MSDKQKYPRAAAIAVAREIVAALKGACDRIIIAGSLRRQKPEVSDVEVVYVPRLIQTGLFEDDTTNLAEKVIESLVTARELEPRPNIKGFITWGPRNKLARHVRTKIPVDLFSTDSECWWNTVVCRTGGKENNLIITTTALKKGWSFEAYGSGFVNTTTGEHYQTQSEEDVYRFIGLPYMEPKDRK